MHAQVLAREAAGHTRALQVIQDRRLLEMLPCSAECGNLKRSYARIAMPDPAACEVVTRLGSLKQFLSGINCKRLVILNEVIGPYAAHHTDQTIRVANLFGQNTGSLVFPLHLQSCPTLGS